MKVGGVPYRTIFVDEDGWGVRVIDQTVLPHRFQLLRLESADDVVRAIRTMVVRGAPLIGAAAAYGVALAMRADPSDASLEDAVERLSATRPTAVNLRWALHRVGEAVRELSPEGRADAAYRAAASLSDEDVELNRAIGGHGLAVLRELGAGTTGRPLNILTHCNAGWLATVDWGTATAPMYRAYDDGLDVHVWVDETRPRLQGAALTAWELGQHGVPHTLIPDSAAAHLMRKGEVDVVIVGTDRTTASGDVTNKIGTYPLALAAADNDVPFYVAVPSPSIDWQTEDASLIPIEQRDAAEVISVRGLGPDDVVGAVRIAPEHTRAANYGFDVTPRHLVTGLITERGVCSASGEGLRRLFPEGAGA
ncbi:MAG: S-methyl-5-thioribose-1-phosphate isomerase [Gemmatimonadetes bacterium]|nr:S-methyl-5-thioribose-1-phosphate isomerase [Gemmatimonadota bacterium]